jgi:hypothetical protein
MSYVEILPEARALSRTDKLRLIQRLAEDLAQEEESPPFAAGQSFPLWSPDRAYDAAAVLLRELQMEFDVCFYRSRAQFEARPKQAPASPA